jgi:serine/threonine protein phosphatase PrpC
MAGMTEGFTKVNQDSFYINTKMMDRPNMTLIACFDGHGMDGHRCSSFLKQNLPEVFESCYNFSA